MKKELKNSNQKNLSKSLREKLQTSKGRIIFALSAVMLIVVLNMIISKTTGFNAIESSYNYIAKAVNGEKDIKSEYTKEIKSVEIQSDDYSEPGSWHIDKSADWTGSGKAKVTFNVDSIMKTNNKNIDVILVMDISGSMYGDKLDKAKEDAIELVGSLLSDEQNKVALITFSSSSQIVSEFTNDKQLLIDKINSFNADWNTNYNVALKNVDKVMSNYTKVSNKDVVTLFLTDGYPNEETPNQIATYELLKDKYPYMIINCIQYEMGKDVIKEIKEISDNQWVADQNTLNNVLFDASSSLEIYEKYEVVDYIDKDYFILDEEKGIEVSTGTYRVEEEDGYQKVIWTIEQFKTGSSAKMDINLLLKDKSLEKGKYYPTNKKEEVNSKLQNEEEKNVKSDKTPVLKNGYEVIYDANTPLGCDLEEIPNELHLAYEKVTKQQEPLNCEGYIFKGWVILDNDVKKVNEDVFVMPEHDVTIRAKWAKPSIEKTMEGAVWVNKILYDVVKDEAQKEDSQVKLYEGDVDDTFEVDANESVYYYTGSNVKNNNVIFGGFCWHIVRTTTTGGVKIAYNGEPSEDGQCLAYGEDAIIYPDTSFSDGSPSDAGYMSNANYSITSLKNRSDLVEEMLYADDVNRINSTFKYLVDKWYKENLDQYSSQLEDTIFCNNRNTNNIASWVSDPTWRVLIFEDNVISSNLTCTRDTDKFSTKNDKAKLYYPVGLLSGPEVKLMAGAGGVGYGYWLASPSEFSFHGYVGDGFHLKMNYVTVGGGIDSGIGDEDCLHYQSAGLRPTVSLKPGTIYRRGDGTKENPFVIEMD